ncbi:MAG: TlpA family protein disulfide reductase [Propionibacteriaceae bacterium]|jgi:thiol-disulfide isomerase/thioredoxin|nr:TlpA family protein disulfide reductase [Propionibacteriaceae bacterium]
MSANLRTAVVLVVTAVLVIGAVVMVRQPWKTDGDVTRIDTGADPSRTLKVGEPAPGFAATTITGEDFSLVELQGQPVWLIFGATWCANCRGEAPDVQAVASAYTGKVTVVAVYVGEAPETVSAYVERMKLTHPQVADSDYQLGRAYSIIGLPTHVFIDSQGQVNKIVVGGISQSAASIILDDLS